MGWYTSGPGDLQYKYGNVGELAAEMSGAGRFSISPRVTLQDEDGEFIEELEFLSDWQTEFEKRGLDWPSLPFEANSLVKDPKSFDWEKYLADLERLVLGHRELFERVAKETDEQQSIANIMIEFDQHIEFDRNEWPELVAFLNAFTEEELLTLEDIRRGTHGKYNDYILPDDKQHVWGKLSDEQQLLLHALGQAVLCDEDLYLSQPGDDTQRDIWSSED
jgi:hypothetical protein